MLYKGIGGRYQRKMKMVSLTIETLIFAALIGVIAGQVANPNGNLSGAALLLYGLITLIVVAGFITYISKKMGLKGGR